MTSALGWLRSLFGATAPPPGTDLAWRTDAAGRLVGCAGAVTLARGRRLLTSRQITLCGKSWPVLTQSLRQGTSFAGVVVRLEPTRGGAARYFAASGTPLRRADGSIAGYQGTALDVTAREGWRALLTAPSGREECRSLSGRALIDALLAGLLRTIGADLIFVSRLDPATDRFWPEFSASTRGLQIDVMSRPYAAAGSPCAFILEQNGPQIFNGTATTSFPAAERLARLGLVSYAGIAIRRRGEAPLVLAVTATGSLADPVRLGEMLTVAAERIAPDLAQALTEKALADSATRLETLLDNLPGMAYRVRINSEGRRRFMFASEASQAITGLSPEQLCAMSPAEVAELCHPDDRPPGRVASLNQLRAGETVESAWRLLRPDGQTRWIMQRERLVAHDGSRLLVDGLILDVTREMDSKREMERQEAQLRAIADYTWDWECWLDPDGSPRWINPGSRRITGMDAAACLKMRDYPLPLLSPQDHALYREAAELAGNGIAVEDIDIRLLPSHGRETWASLSIRPIQSAPGAVVSGLRFTIRDISRRKLTEGALRQQQAETKRILAALDLAREGVMVTAADGRVIYANAAAALLIGHADTTSIKGYGWREIGLADSPWTPLLDTIAASLDSLGVWRGELSLPNPRNKTQPRCLETRFSELPEGGFIAVFTDISERKRNEQDMRDSEGRYRTLFNAAADAILVMSGARIIECNPKAEQMFGLSRGELIGHSPQTFSPLRQPDGRLSADKAMDLVAAALAGQPQSFEWHHLCPDGREFYADVSLTTVSQQGRPMIFSLMRDVTERRRRDEERHQTRKMEALGQLAGGVAHDFNNLLGAILGFAQFIAEDSAEASPQFRHAERIILAGQRAKALVRQILTFSRRTDAEHRPLKLAAALTETQQLLAASIPASTRIALEMEAAEATVLADPDQISQVLLNLCINAHDAMGGRPGTVRVGLRLTGTPSPELLHLARRTADASGGQAMEILPPAADGGLVAVGGAFDPSQASVTLEVVDAGPGIRPDIFARMFEPFFTTKDKGRGTGLGLAVVHGVVISHGGALVVRSVSGQGTCFQVVLPLCAEADDVGDPTPAAAALPSFKARVLLVDDDTDFCDMLMIAMERQGLEVAACANPLDAIEAFRDDPDAWDVLVTDQTMPDMLGADLVRAIRAIRSDLPCIICSGYPEELTPTLAKDGGAASLLPKPVDIKALLMLIARLTART